MLLHRLNHEPSKHPQSQHPSLNLILHTIHTIFSILTSAFLLAPENQLRTHSQSLPIIMDRIIHLILGRIIPLIILYSFTVMVKPPAYAFWRIILLFDVWLHCRKIMKPPSIYSTHILILLFAIISHFYNNLLMVYSAAVLIRLTARYHMVNL
jgi:hypothetical protein